jgi:EmrB/QacA subfamily drug resistance transporter
MSRPRDSVDTRESTTSVDARRWRVLALVAAAQLVIVFDSSVVNIALPSAQSALGMSDSAKQWVIAAYTLTFGGFLLVGGRLADLVGRKRIFLIGLTGFAVASVVGGLAVGPVMLPLARAGQGVFAAMLAPSGLALLNAAFTDGRERARAFGIFGAAVGSGQAVGMVLGGVLTEFGSWRWCLLVNVPIVLAILVPAIRLLAPDTGGGSARLDLPGAVTGTLGVAALLFGIGQAETAGWGAASTIWFCVAGIVLLGAFIQVERRSARPMMPMRIVLDRVRGTGYLVAFLVGAALLSFYLLLTYYLQIAQGMSPLVTGLAFVPAGVGILVGSLGAGRVLGHLAPGTVTVVGLLLGAVGTAYLGVLDPESSFWLVVAPAQFVSSVGVGAALTTVTKITLDGVPPEDSGVASALTNAMRQVGGAMGVAVLNIVAVSVTAGDTSPAGLVRGYVVALLAGAGLLVVAAVAVLAMTCRPDGRK